MERIDLLLIPGVGKRIKMRLSHIGINCVADLIGTDPEELYLKDAIDKGRTEDRCLFVCLSFGGVLCKS